jgi:hypothetical protein
LTLVGSNAVTANASANGGAGGTGVSQGAGGGATATLTATARTTVSATVSAASGVGGTVTGPASATLTATGANGSFNATAAASRASGQLVVSDYANTTGSVSGTASAVAKAAITGAASALLTTGEVAFITGAPNAATTSAVLAANSNIAALFGATPVFFGVGELGGAHTSVGNTAQTITSTLKETVDLTQLAVRGDLLVGFYNGTAVGSGVTNVTFDLYADGIQEVHQVFATAAQAATWFTNHAIDLGSLASGQPLGANSLTLQVVLSVTSTTAGGGFYGDLILGDPPKVAPTPRQFAEAIAGFASGGGSPMAQSGTVWSAPAMLLATPHVLG